MYRVEVKRRTAIAAAAVLLVMTMYGGAHGMGMIDGVAGPDFAFTAKSGHISSPEGNTIYFWGFANGDGSVQYPGPTMLVNEGDTVTVTLTNTLDVPVSIVFPGQMGVAAESLAEPTQQGLLTLEALPGGTVRYTFTAMHPGTYLYRSGTRQELQVEMGLMGALIIYPMGGMKDGMGMQAYNHPDSAFDHEYLFLLSEMEPDTHQKVEYGVPVDNTTYFPVNWFINGRCAPDTMLPPYVDWLPTQPYNCMPMMHPGDRLLMRVIGGGRDLHPFHYHGNHAKLIAKDGRLLSSGMGMGADIGNDLFTIQSVPGGTYDLIFTWTGEGLGWDIYGHAPEDPLEPNEYAPDHGKPLPVILPENKDLTFGGMWSGSPFLGAMGGLPPGEGGLNPWAGYTYMWHSHTEKEMTNNNIFPGGMMTMLIIVPHGVDLMGMKIPFKDEQHPAITLRRP